ncbi:MAG: hypothetical protein ACQEW9_15005 [Bacteroidota bacterium]
MKELSIEQMEMVSGGWSFGCTMAVLGGIGVVASIISIPATGPIGLSTAVALGTSAVTTGGSLGECFYYYASK